MNRSCASMRICYIGTLALALLATVLRTVALFCCFDAHVGYFQSGILPTMCQSLCVLAFLFPLVCAFVMRKTDVAGMKAQMQPTAARPLITAILPMAVLITASILMLVLYVRGTESTTVSTHKMLLYLFVLGMISSLFCAARCGLKPGTVITVLLGMVLLAWGILAIGYTYFDPFTPMNSPVKISIQFGILSVLLATTSNLRALLGKYAPRSGMFFHSLAVFFCFNASLPTMIAHMAGVRQTTVHFLLASVLFAFAVYEVTQITRLVGCYDGTEMIEAVESAEAATEEAPVEAEATENTENTENAEDSAPETPLSGGEEA